MSVKDLMMPFTVLLNWLRTYPITIAGFTFTFMDMFVWTAIAGLLIGFIVKRLEGD